MAEVIARVFSTRKRLVARLHAQVTTLRVRRGYSKSLLFYRTAYFFAVVLLTLFDCVANAFAFEVVNDVNLGLGEV